MTEVSRRELFPGVWLRTVHTNKFKSAYLSVTLLAPLEPETAAANALIPSVLRRGTAAHPDMESLSAALDELYGGAIEPAVRRKGETQCVGFVASFLDDAYALEGEPILEPAAALLGELLLSPRTEGEGFLPDYVRQEQNNLIDRIRAQVNDKRRYASARLCQLMCREEAFGVDKLGDEAHAAAITPEGLWARYQQLLRTAEIEVYYCGSAQPERAARALTAALSGRPREEERLEPECEVRLHAGPEPQLVEERLEVSQGKLALGFRTGGITCWEEEYPALVLCNAIFGGTPLSKLFLNVREKLSLCYYASSVLEKMKGLVLVSSGSAGGHPPGRDRGLGAGGSPPYPDQRPSVHPGRPGAAGGILAGPGGRRSGHRRGGAGRTPGLRHPGAGGRGRPEAGAGHRVFSEGTGGLRPWSRSDLSGSGRRCSTRSWTTG